MRRLPLPLPLQSRPLPALNLLLPQSSMRMITAATMGLNLPLAKIRI